MPNAYSLLASFGIYFLFFLLTSLFGPTAAAQSPSFCGSFGRFRAASTNPDSIVYDRFGNTYLKSDFGRPGVNARSCTAGYFELEINETIPADEEAVICRVFADVSSLILRRQLTDNCGDLVQQQPIFIRVGRQIDSAGVEDGFLGTASPLYQPLFDGCPAGTHGVQHSNIMRKLNGEQLLTNNDGVLNIDIDPPKPYYYGTNPNGISAGQYDLYSVVFHEVMHLIGFSGTTGANGQPNTDFSFDFSAWDRLLHTTPNYDPNGSQDINAMLTANCINNCYQLNTDVFPTVQDFQNAVIDNCTNGSIDIIVGNNGLAPISGGGGGNFPNQISHLNPNCGDPNYVMQPSLDTGVVRRVLTFAETNILCALGYQTPTCDGCFMAVNGNNPRLNSNQGNCCDLTYSTCTDQILMIPISDLLCNDFTNGPDLELTAVNPPFSNSTYSVRIVGDSIEFISSERAFYRLIPYTVEGCNCQLLTGEFAVNVLPCEIDCDVTDPCQDVLCLNGFEDYRVTGDGGASGQFYPGEPFWIDNILNNSPDVRTCPTTNNTYIHCGSFGQLGGTEGFAFSIDPPLDPGCSLSLDFDLSQEGEDTQAAALIIKGSDQYPCTIVGSLIGAGCGNTPCGNTNQNYVCIDTVSTSAMPGTAPCPAEWSNHQITWVNDQSYTINTLIFHSQSRDLGGSRNGLLIDNLKGIQSCADNIGTSHSISPQTACSGESLAIQLDICLRMWSTSLHWTIYLRSLMR